MIHVIHTPTGWKVCQNYPESRVIRCYGKPDCCEGRRCDYLAHRETIKASIANAVDVREEDQEWVKRKVFFRGNYFPLPDMEESEQELKDWKPNDNQVYALPELEMRIKEHCQHKGIHNSACIYSKLAHVFRKKEEKVAEEPKGYIKAQEAADRREQVTQILEAHYGNGKAIHKAVHEIDKFYIDMPKEEPKMEEDQGELWDEAYDLLCKYYEDDGSNDKELRQEILSKFHLTRVKAELKGEKE